MYAILGAVEYLIMVKYAVKIHQDSVWPYQQNHCSITDIVKYFCVLVSDFY